MTTTVAGQATADPMVGSPCYSVNLEARTPVGFAGADPQSQWNDGYATSVPPMPPHMAYPPNVNGALEFVAYNIGSLAEHLKDRRKWRGHT